MQDAGAGAEDAYYSSIKAMNHCERRRKHVKYERSLPGTGRAACDTGGSGITGGDTKKKEPGADQEEKEPGSPGMGDPERGINGAVHGTVGGNLFDAAECVLRGGEQNAGSVYYKSQWKGDKESV